MKMMTSMKLIVKSTRMTRNFRLELASSSWVSRHPVVKTLLMDFYASKLNVAKSSFSASKEV